MAGSDGAGGVASSRRKRTERSGAAAAAATAATTVSASNRGSSSGVDSLPWLPTCQLVEFCLGAVEHPDNSARLRESSHRFLRRLAGQINKVNGEPSWRSRPTVRVWSGSTEFLALVDSGASHSHAVRYLSEDFKLQQGGDQWHRHRTNIGKCPALGNEGDISGEFGRGGTRPNYPSCHRRGAIGVATASSLRRSGDLRSKDRGRERYGLLSLSFGTGLPRPMSMH